MDLLRSGLNIRCVTMGTDGLWLMLLKHAPSPEHREMESVIGAQRIRRNKVCRRLEILMYHANDTPNI